MSEHPLSAWLHLILMWVLQLEASRDAKLRFCTHGLSRQIAVTVMQMVKGNQGKLLSPLGT